MDACGTTTVVDVIVEEMDDHQVYLLLHNYVEIDEEVKTATRILENINAGYLLVSHRVNANGSLY